MAEDIDILSEATEALTMIMLMRNETTTKKPDHKFVEYFNRIEITIRQMRERNLKQLGMIKSLELSLSQLNNLDDEFERHIDDVESKPKEMMDDGEWSRQQLTSKQNETPF